MKYLYASFDLYPSSKGAATHIYHMFSAGLSYFHSGILAVIGNEDLPVYQAERNYTIHRFNLKEENFLKRTEEFSVHLEKLMESTTQLELVHYRDIWTGTVVERNNYGFKTIYEVNSLPSIELKVKYPNLDENFLEKIRERESFLLNECNTIITPSLVTRNYLIESKKINSNKVVHIPNGSEIIETYNSPTEITNDYIIYFGALQDWQGIDILLKAFALLKDLVNLKLLICIAGSENSARKYIKLSQKLEIYDNIIWKYNLRKEELFPYIQNALISIVPLREDERNLIQGASPIKIFESMACRTPLLVSDLPITREILTERVNAKFFRADRPLELAVQIRFLLENPELRNILSKNAYETFLKRYTWDSIKNNLQEIYARLVLGE